MLLFVSLSLASEPTPDDCEYYMGLGATKSSVAGRTCCYKKGLSLERETQCGHGCGYVGCDYTEGDYCEHAGHALKVPHNAAERDFVATLTAGDDDDTGVWIQTRRRDDGWKDGDRIVWDVGEPADDSVSSSCVVMKQDQKDSTRYCDDEAICVCVVCISDFPAPPPTPPPSTPPPPSASPSPPPPCPPPSPPSSPPPPPPTSPPSPPGPPSPQAPPSAVPAIVGGAVGGAGGLVLVAVGIILYVRSSGRRQRAAQEERAHAAETQRKADDARPVPVSHPSGEQELAYKVTGVVAA